VPSTCLRLATLLLRPAINSNPAIQKAQQHVGTFPQPDTHHLTLVVAAAAHASEPVNEYGKHYLEELLPCGAHFHKSIGSEELFRCNPAQSFYDVPPEPHRIVVPLVEGDPGKGQVGFFCLTPLGQERRLAVACRGAYEGSLAVRRLSEKLEQSGMDQLLGARRRCPQLGLEDYPGRIDAWVASGVDGGLLGPGSLARPLRTCAVRPMRWRTPPTSQ
jgi:hypothetical protein